MLRRILKRPAFFVAVVPTLTLGIGGMVFLPLATVAATAAGPAGRAMKVDPMEALRQE